MDADDRNTVRLGVDGPGDVVRKLTRGVAGAHKTGIESTDGHRNLLGSKISYNDDSGRFDYSKILGGRFDTENVLTGKGDITPEPKVSSGIVSDLYRSTDLFSGALDEVSASKMLRNTRFRNLARALVVLIALQVLLFLFL